MDIQNIDLRRGDFEGMHPKAKLFGFDEDKKQYTGDGVESINDQWTTWCACIGMLCLDGKEAQAVPEGFVLVPREMPESFDNGLYAYSNNISIVDSNSDGFIPMSDINHAEVWKLVVESQEPAND